MLVMFVFVYSCLIYIVKVYMQMVEKVLQNGEDLVCGCLLNIGRVFFNMNGSDFAVVYHKNVSLYVAY